jgi:beta-glucosidase
MAKAEFAPVLLLGAIRLGGCLKLADEEKAIEDAVRLAAESDVAFCFTGSTMDWEAEGGDRQDLHLPGRADELVGRLLEVKPETVISNQSGAVFHMPWADRAATVMQTWFAGNETGKLGSPVLTLTLDSHQFPLDLAGNAILDVITGKVNPSGRLPMSWPKKIEDCTAHINWGAERGKVHYGEGVFVSWFPSLFAPTSNPTCPAKVGYRGYEECKRDLTWNFGHGLSYSTFGELE